MSGVARSNVAAIRADGTLDPTWNPSTDGIVYALAASSDGSKIFVGGSFTTVGGQAHGRLAAVTPDTGALVSGWTTTAKNNTVRALEADAGDRLYVGGNFGSIGGRAVARLAALSQSTGTVDPSFAPTPNNTVRGLALSQDATKVYAAGSFTSVNGPVPSRSRRADLRRQRHVVRADRGRCRDLDRRDAERTNVLRDHVEPHLRLRPGVQRPGLPRSHRR